jgi:hypothetical protein
MTPEGSLVLMMWMLAAIGGIFVLYDWWTRRKGGGASPRR